MLCIRAISMSPRFYSISTLSQCLRAVPMFPLSHCLHSLSLSSLSSNISALSQFICNVKMSPHCPSIFKLSPCCPNVSALCQCLCTGSQLCLRCTVIIFQQNCDLKRQKKLCLTKVSQNFSVLNWISDYRFYIRNNIRMARLSWMTNGLNNPSNTTYSDSSFFISVISLTEAPKNCQFRPNLRAYL